MAPAEAVEGGSLAGHLRDKCRVGREAHRETAEQQGWTELEDPEENTASDGMHAGTVAECWKRMSDGITSKLSDCFQMFFDIGSVPDELKSVEIFRQGKDGTDPTKGWRYLDLLNDIGKAFEEPSEHELLETTAKRGRSTCDAVATVTESHATWHCLHRELPRRKPKAQRMISFFVDLSKAFDLMPRAGLFPWEVQAAGKSGSHGAKSLHNGTCYLLRDASGDAFAGAARSQIRQGSVEGPLLFVLLHDHSCKKLEGAEELWVHNRGRCEAFPDHKIKSSVVR